MLNFTDSCDEDFDRKQGPGAYCPPLHDQIVCWPATQANSTAYKLCAENSTATANRVCFPNGTWDARSNYNACLAIPADDSQPAVTTAINIQDMDQLAMSEQTALNLSILYFFGSVISLLVLTISLSIFLVFKSLQCPRTSIHKHLVVSFMLRFTVVAIIMEPLAFMHDAWYKKVEWLCRIMVSLKYFAMLANFCWMLVEGLFLHLILVLRPLSNEKAPFVVFYFIGWVLPFIVVVAWSIVMHFEHDVPCWNLNSSSPYIFIIYIPIMIVLLVNLLILLNLVRIVIAKLCTGHTAERRKICRTIKSTVVLVFLLGIINLLFFFRPQSTPARTVYRYVNALLPLCQGIFVSLLYCVMNAEVRRAIKKKWVRFREFRSMSHHSTARRRSSRTSLTLFVTNQNQCNGNEHVPMIDIKDQATDSKHKEEPAV